MKPHVLCLALFPLSILGGCQGQSTGPTQVTAPSNQQGAPTENEPRLILERVGKGIFSDDDQRYTKQMLEGNTASRTMGLTILAAAVERKLYPKQEFFATMVQQASKYKSASFGRLLATIAQTNTNLTDYDEELLSKLPQAAGEDSAINQEEKSAITHLLQEENASTRALAARVAAQYSALPAKDLSWLLGEVETQQGNTAGGERDFWQLIHQIVEARNPSSAGP